MLIAVRCLRLGDIKRKRNVYDSMKLESIVRQTHTIILLVVYINILNDIKLFYNKGQLVRNIEGNSLITQKRLGVYNY